MIAVSPNSDRWQKVELGDFCEFAYGKSLPAKTRSGTGYPVYGSNGPVGLHDDPLTKGETIVVGRKGSFGEVHYSAIPCSPIDTTYFVTRNQTDAHLPWLARRLRCLGLGRLNRAAAIPGLNRTDAYRQTLLLPPLPEQKRIARILDAADALRAKRRESLAQLDTLLQSTFLEIFGDPVVNPMGWVLCTLEEATTRVTDGTHQGPTWSESGLPFLFVSNIRDRAIDFQTTKFISEEEHERLTTRCPIEVGDVLYTTVGSYGNPARVREDSGRFAFQRHIAHIKPRHDLIDSQFLEAMLDSPVGRNQADRCARGVAQKTLNLRELKRFKIFLPPLDEQQNFATIVQSIELQKTRLRAHQSELDTLFASLQSRAFRGDL